MANMEMKTWVSRRTKCLLIWSLVLSKNAVLMKYKTILWRDTQKKWHSEEGTIKEEVLWWCRGKDQMLWKEGKKKPNKEGNAKMLLVSEEGIRLSRSNRADGPLTRHNLANNILHKILVWLRESETHDIEMQCWPCQTRDLADAELFHGSLAFWDVILQVSCSHFVDNFDCTYIEDIKPMQFLM